MSRKFVFGICAAACLLAANAWGHAHLESAQPAPDSKNAEVGILRLVFSEAVEPKLSSIHLESGEDRIVVEPGAEIDPADARVLTVHLFEKLPPGVYKVRWAVVAGDGHRMSGSYSFLVSR